MTKHTTIHHFPVGNGDMSLIRFASGSKYITVLVDTNIRQICEKDDDKCHVLEELHALLDKDSEGRPYVDAFILSHPDEDHIRGFESSFHTGSEDTYKFSKKDDEFDKIVIKEIWSSTLVFKRKSKNHSLCPDALVFNTEANRRIELYRKTKNIGVEGDRVRLIGKDDDAKTSDIPNIVYDIDDTIQYINEKFIPELNAYVLGPRPDSEFEGEESPDKNLSSIIIRWGIASNGFSKTTNKILLGGDASVEAWEIIWSKYKSDLEKLEYDILLAPHHCSWHTLSHDSYKKSSNPKISEDAKSALSQANDGAVIVSSSDTILNNKNDPPNHQAMLEYKSILKSGGGVFKCLNDHKPSKNKFPEVLVYRLTYTGPQLEKKASNKEKVGAGLGGVGSTIGHG